MKKEYKKPTMRVVELRHKVQLLVGSGDDWNHDIGYAPCQSSDENHLV